MNARGQILCAWAGLLCPVTMFIGLFIAGYFPPQSPMMTAAEVGDFYRQNATNIRFGMIFMEIAGALYCIFAGVISAQMRRVEHRNAPALSYAQLALGAAGSLVFIIPAMMYITASFRPERSPEVTQIFHDASYIIIVGVWANYTLQNLIIGFLIIADKSSTPVFPRWLGYCNIWLGLLIVPAALMPFFKNGPFAWNGILGYWTPGSAFFIWFCLMGYHLIKAVKRQAAEEALIAPKS